MKVKAIATVFLISFCSVYAAAQTPNPAYDKSLATAMGADDYGMKGGH